MPRRLLRTRTTTACFVALAVVVAGATAPAQGQTDPTARKSAVDRQQTVVAGQINVLEASAADVQAGLAALKGRVAAAEAALAQAQAAASAANAALAAAVAQQAAAERQVEERRARLRAAAVDSYVNVEARTASMSASLEPPHGNVDDRALRLALAGIRADEDGIALRSLLSAEGELQAATARARAAADDAAATEAAAQADADAVHAARDRQSAYAADVERRLDDKLAEAAALRAIDRTLSDQIMAQERALAAQVSGGTRRPPPPPGSENVVPPPRPPVPDLVTTHGITVARSIAANLGAMIDAAAKDHITFTGSGYRSYDDQVALRRQNCGTTNYDIYARPPSECSPPTARPGESNHQRGLAVDFAANGQALTSHDDPGWIWLSSHAASFGFYNLDSEPWHWSVDGT